MKQQDMMNNLDKIYGLVVDGITHVAEPVTQLADKYVRKSRSVDEAAVKLINAQIAKSTASGFV